MNESRNPESGGRAVVPVKGGQNVNLVSNQYLLKVGPSVNVYQYALDITPMHVWDANLVYRVMKLKRAALERALGPHVCSGKSVYTLAEIDSDLVFKVGKIQGDEYTIAISVDTCSVINLNSNFSNKENDVKQQIINVIIKDAFRSTDLRQIGRSPRFFDTTNPINMMREGLRIWSGFKASAYQSNMGCVLAIDNIFKFMSTKTCLDRLREINQNSHSQH